MVPNTQPPGDHPPGLLSITQLSARTGVPAATLRSWESRYGAPVPGRLAGGHRRYREEDVALVEEILRQRAIGVGLPMAIERAVRPYQAAEVSIFAGLRRRYPDLAPWLLGKRSLIAISHAIEDECCARAEQPQIFVSFQRRKYYEQSRRRWGDMARTAASVVVFADFGEGHRSPARVREVSLPPDAPLLREWAIVCDAPDYPACLVGWEHPGQEDTPDRQRRFEALLTLDARAVADAAAIATALADEFAPGTLAGATNGTTVGGRASRAAEDLTLAGPRPGASPDLRRATGLFQRMIAYVEDAHTAPS